MRVHLGSDHAGLDLKAHLISWLTEHGYEPVDHGPFVYDALDDYPVFCLRAAEGVAAEQARGLDSLGVVVGGSGNGEQMAANKVPGIRAALCHDAHSAHQCVEHDDTNVLCLGAQIVGEWLALDLLRTFLAAEFRDEEPFRRRLAKLAELERRATSLPDRPPARLR